MSVTSEEAVIIGSLADTTEEDLEIDVEAGESSSDEEPEQPGAMETIPEDGRENTSGDLEENAPPDDSDQSEEEEDDKSESEGSAHEVEDEGAKSGLAEGAKSEVVKVEPLPEFPDTDVKIQYDRLDRVPYLHKLS